MSDNDVSADYDDDDGSESPIVNHKRKAPTAATKKRCRKIVFAWDRKLESALIAAVKKEPRIWDSSHKDYKNPNTKIDRWKQVAAELNVDGVDDVGARLKWQALRSNFKAHLAKFRARTSGQTTAEIKTVSWPHFGQMMFVESGEVTESSTSTSTIKLEGACNDTSILHDLTQLPNPQSSLETIQRTPIPKRKRRKEGRMATSAPTQSLSSNSNFGSMRNLTAEDLGTITRRQDDRFDLFGQLIASNLRRLPENVSFNLECRIMQMIYPLPLSISPASSHATIVDQDSVEITDPNSSRLLIVGQPEQESKVRPNSMSITSVSPPQIDTELNQPTVNRPIAQQLGLLPPQRSPTLQTTNSTVQISTKIPVIKQEDPDEDFSGTLSSIEGIEETSTIPTVDRKLSITRKLSNDDEREKAKTDDNLHYTQKISDRVGRDEYLVYGEYIANKFYKSNRSKAEIDVAMKLINGIMFNLTTGIYSCLSCPAPNEVGEKERGPSLSTSDFSSAVSP